MSVSDVDVAGLEAAHGGRLRVTRRRRAVVSGWLWVLGGLLAVVVSWWFVLTRGSGALLSAQMWQRAARFAGELLGLGAQATPALLQGEVWAETAWLTLETLAMGVLATGLSGAAALATVAFASRTLTYGQLRVTGPLVGRGVFAVTRAVHIVTRAVPEFFWALLLVFALQSGYLAAVLALALHNFGVLGRLGADVVEDCDPTPLRALRTAGAGSLQVLFYGVLPQVLPQFTTFLLYRWEVLTRATVVVGLIAGAGLGYPLELNMSRFFFTHVTVILVAYVVLVWAVDLASSGMRRLAR